MKVENKEQNLENFRMYHQLQYDRIGKLEASREMFSNFIITLSAGLYLFDLNDNSNSNIMGRNILLVFVIIINFSFLLYSKTTIKQIRIHKKRAKLARYEYAPTLNIINKNVDRILNIERHKTASKSGSQNTFLSRKNIHNFLHISIIILTFFLIQSH